MTGLKKKLDSLTVAEKKQLIITDESEISISRRCELLGLNRSSLYYQQKEVSKETLNLMREIDEINTKYPFYGSRKIVACLRRKGYKISCRRVRKLMKKLGLEAIYPRPNLSIRNIEHKLYPYLLRDVAILNIDHVWSADITYLRLMHGFVYLVAIIDWHSRYVLDWEISTSLEADFCINTLERVLINGKCDIFNTDQGAQFTTHRFTKLLIDNEVKISMDGRGRALDNIFVERLWRSVKYECIYLREFATVAEVKLAVKEYFKFYNYERLHQSLGYKTPSEVYFK